MWFLYLLFTLGAFTAITLFLIAPRRKRDCAPFDRTLYAHRGLHDNNICCPENSLAAFRAAKEAGYGVELDVRFTADRQIVVFHDDTLLRMCGVDRRVDECTYAELQEMRLIGTEEHIPLLSEVLELLEDTTILCEIKTMRSFFDTSLCDETYKALADYAGPVCIESFNPNMVRWFRQNAPHVIRGILSMRYGEKDIKPAILRPILSSLMVNCVCRPDFIAYRYSDISHPIVRLCRIFRPTMIAWTVRDQGAAHTIEPQFDTYIFEGFTPQSTR